VIGSQSKIGTLFLAVLLAASTTLVACQSAHDNAPPPPMPVPLTEAAVTHFPGTPLSGPQPIKIDPAAFNSPLDTHVTWIALETANPKSLDLVASQAKLVTGTRGGAAVFASASLTRDARIAWLKSDHDLASTLDALQTGQRAPLATLRAALPVGATAAFTLADTEGSGDDTFGNLRKRGLEIDLYRAAPPANGKETLQLGFAIQDFGRLTPGPGSATQPTDQLTIVFQRELAVIDHAFPALPAGAVLVTPFHFSTGGSKWTAALISISPPPAGDPTFAGVLSQCKNDLQPATPASAAPSDAAAGFDRSLGLLSSPTRRRAALVYLADQTGATICQDVALVADDTVLAHLADEVKTEAGPALQAGDVTTAGWAMDRSAITVLQPLLTSATLPDELFAVLTEHLGEPGRHAASLDDVMHGAASRQDLDQRLVAENFIYLEDSSPASRVRAFNWLQARHIAPAGFDPLAPAKQRRKALDQALSAPPATQATGGTQ
jgi:hypothetical protein